MFDSTPPSIEEKKSRAAGIRDGHDDNLMLRASVKKHQDSIRREGKTQGRVLFFCLTWPMAKL